MKGTVILDEVEVLLEKIMNFHKAHGRKIATYFKRSRKGRAGIEQLESFGVAIPDDFRALYWNYDGAQPNIMYEKATQVFGEFNWSNSSTLFTTNRVSRLRVNLPLTKTLYAFRGYRAVSLDLAPALAKAGKCPLIATLSALSQERFVAFDSTVDMLRTVAEAQSRGIFWFEGDETRYDKKAFAAIVKEFNQRDTFWDAYANDAIDWKQLPLSPEQMKLTPEVGRIISDALLGRKDDS